LHIHTQVHKFHGYEEEYLNLYTCGLQDMEECIYTPGNMRWNVYCEPDVTRLPVDVVVALPCQQNYSHSVSVHNRL
jgi:hypothetical protein